MTLSVVVKGAGTSYGEEPGSPGTPGNRSFPVEFVTVPSRGEGGGYFYSK